MVCGIVLGKAKTAKVGMAWYEFNIVNQSINQSGRYRAARAAKKTKMFREHPERAALENLNL